MQKVVFGQVLQAGQGQIPSRQAQIKGGIPKEVPSETVNKVCASGIRSVALDRHRRCARATSTPPSRAAWRACRALPTCCPARASASAWATRRRSTAMINDGLAEPVHRQAHDAGGQRGRRGARADARPTWTGGRCAATSWPSRRPTRAGCPRRSCRSRSSRKKGETVVEIDEAPRRDTSLEALAKLPPMYVKDGSHTAGNAPGRERRRRRAGAAPPTSGRSSEGRQPLARIVASARGRRRLRLPRPHARQGRQARAREGRAEGRRHRPLGDQRGVRVGRDQLRADARHRRRTR